MFEWFTDQAKTVVRLALEEAWRLDHDYIGSEHLLLGLLRQDGGTAARALGSLGLSLERVRGSVEEVTGRGQTTPGGRAPLHARRQ